MTDINKSAAGRELASWAPRNESPQIQQARVDLESFVLIQGWSPQDAMPSELANHPIGKMALANRTVTRLTLAHYIDRGHQLLHRFADERGLTRAVFETGEPILSLCSPIEFSIWLINLRPTISAATWRTYKQGALCVILPIDDGIIAIEKIQAAGSKGTKCLRKAAKPCSPLAKTSAKRSPKISLDELHALCAECLRRSSRKRKNAQQRGTSEMLSDLLIAGLVTALRPGEWRQTVLLQDHIPGSPAERLDWQLLVYNSKSSNGRGNGKMRLLDLSEMHEDILLIVANVVNDARGGDLQWSRKLARCAELLADIGLKIWPDRRDRITLISCRHQCLANLKRKSGTVVAAAVAGHSDPNSPDRHYGHKRFGWKPKKKTIPNRHHQIA